MGLTGISGPSGLSAIMGGGNGVFDPDTLADQVLWLKSSAGAHYQESTFTTLATDDGHPVGGIQDQFGLGNHYIQAVSTRRYTLKLNQINGFPAYRLDGVDDLLGRNAIILSTPFTMWMVFKIEHDAPPQAFQTIADFTDTGTGYLTYQASSPRFQLYMGAELNLNLQGGIWQYCTVVVNGASSKLRVSGSEATGNPGANVPNRSFVGGEEFNPPKLDWSEKILVNHAADADEIADVEGYLTSKYGL